MRSLVRLAPIALAFALCHCASWPALRAAEDGKIAGLSALIDADVKRGAVSEEGAITLARAIARGEVERARGPLGADLIRQLQGCARDVDDALEKRSESAGDAAAAAAVLVRVEAGLVFDAQDYVPWAMAAPGELGSEFRAVGARVLVRKSQGDLRRKLFGDGDQEVRLAALTASVRAADPTDVEALIEAARLDPHPPARLAAIRAAGAIGGERVVLALKDLWALGDEGSRVAIAGAWATPRSIAAGGRRELVWAEDTQHGPPQLEAAYALIKLGGEGSAEAAAVIERAITGGVAREKIVAINIAPLSSPSLRAAVVKAGSDPDDAVALAAISRRFEVAPDQGGAAEADRPALKKRLLEIANGRAPMLALLAKGALARAGVKEVLPLLDRDAHGSDPQARKGAGMALVSLGELPRAAVLAGDADARVRVSVSCAILRAAPAPP